MVRGHHVVRGLGAQHVNGNAGNAYNSCWGTRASVPDHHALHQVPEHSDDQGEHRVNEKMFAAGYLSSRRHRLRPMSFRPRPEITQHRVHVGESYFLFLFLIA